MKHSYCVNQAPLRQMYGRDCETDFIATHLYTCNAQYLQWRAPCLLSAQPCQLICLRHCTAWERLR